MALHPPAPRQDSPDRRWTGNPRRICRTAGKAMSDILVNGWFWDRLDSGSGQYVNALLHHWPQPGLEDKTHIHLLVPEPIQDRELPAPNMTLHRASKGHLPAALAKIKWEQFTVPRWGRQLGVRLVWHPYWTASFWQPQPQLTTVHDVIPALLPAYRAAARQRLYIGLVTAATRRVRHVLTVSESAGKDLEEHLGLPRDRISVVHNGVAAPEDSSAREAETVLRDLNLPGRYFLYLGSFERRKNVAVLLNSFAAFRQQGGDPEMNLVLAGRLPTRDTLVLQDPRPRIQELGLSSHVRLLGYVTEEEKAALYVKATAFVFPGKYEGFGLMVAEAMQAGTPVITSKH